jgi:hypothetical protein
MSIIVDDYARHLYELAKLQGIAVSTVADGSMVLIRIDFIKKWIAENPDKDHILVFAKRPGAQA